MKNVNPFLRQALGNFEKFLLPLAQNELHYLEIGCLSGDSLVWASENLLGHVKSTVTGVDPYETNDIYGEMSSFESECRRRIREHHRTTLIKSRSAEWLASMWPQVNLYDVIYIDGDHSYPAVMMDAVLSWRLLKPGGLMAFDDAKKMCKEPIAWFIQCFREQLHDDLTFHRNRQKWIRKRA